MPENVGYEFGDMGAEKRFYGGFAHVLVPVSFWATWTVKERPVQVEDEKFCGRFFETERWEGYSKEIILRWLGNVSY